MGGRIYAAPTSDEVADNLLASIAHDTETAVGKPLCGRVQKFYFCNLTIDF